MLYRVAQKERNSRCSRFSGLCSNQQLLSSLCWIEHLFPIIITSRSSNLVGNFLFYETFLMDCHFRDLPDFQSFEARWQINGKSQKWQPQKNWFLSLISGDCSPLQASQGDLHCCWWRCSKGKDERATRKKIQVHCSLTWINKTLLNNHSRLYRDWEWL